MIVYVEVVLLDNFCLDLFILCASTLSLRIKVSRLRLVFGAIVGAIGATLSVYAGGVLVYFVKVGILLAMCITSVGFGKKLFWHILTTLAYTFISGGCIVGLFNLCNVSYVNADGFFYQTQVPLFVYAAALALVAFVGYSLFCYRTDFAKVAPYLTDVTLSFGGRTVKVRAFRDSGNTLTYQGCAVCFVVGKIDGFADYFARCLVCGQTVKVQVCTVAATTEVPAVEAILTEQDNNSRKIYLALPRNKCPSFYQLIVNGN